MISKIKGQGFLTFLIISSLCLSLITFRMLKENILLQVNYYQTVDEEYVPNTMVPYSKNYHSSCKGLFATGTLIQPCINDSYSKLNTCARNIAEQWKPDGCKLMHYTKEMMNTCFSTFSKSGRKTLHLIGDSIVRGIFNSFYRKYTGKKQPYERFETTDMYIKEADVTIKYLVKIYLHRNEFAKILGNEDRPIFMLFANNLHFIQTNMGKDPFKTFEDYEKKLTDLVPTLNRISEITKMVWPLGATVHKDAQLIHELVPYRVQLVDLYNDVANKILKPSNVTLIYSFRSIGNATYDSYLDPTHMGSLANDIIVQILLNYICNNQWQETDVQENVEDICCSKQDKLT